MADFFEVGKIVNTQGIKGEVRVFPMTDDLTRFELLDEVYVSIRNEMQKRTIETVRYHKQFVLIKFKGIDSMTEAERYKNAMLKIPPEWALPLDEGEYYMRDLIGMAVSTVEGENLGILDDIIQTGANDVYIVKADGKKDLLIPAIKQCVVAVNVPDRKMTVKLPEGLRDA
ncbi:MAG: ribosome maturation factor RimM [Clostridiales bacterium]|nr:ribosome maturation factor RimM [Clostridiales bacterium]